MHCRENIEKDIELERRRAENPDLMEDDVDAVPCITRSASQTRAKAASFETQVACYLFVLRVLLCLVVTNNSISLLCSQFEEVYCTDTFNNML